MATFSRDNKTKWANDFFPPLFLWRYFFYFFFFNQLRLAVLTADQHELCLDHTIRRPMLEIETGHAHLGIICGLPASPECGTIPKVWIQSHCYSDRLNYVGLLSRSSARRRVETTDMSSHEPFWEWIQCSYKPGFGLCLRHVLYSLSVTTRFTSLCRRN